jgi:hypothetical protein
LTEAHAKLDVLHRTFVEAKVIEKVIPICAGQRSQKTLQQAMLGRVQLECAREGDS